VVSQHKYGCLPDDPSVPRVRLAHHLRGSFNIPASVNWGAIPSIGMLDNDLWGCCVFASDGHICEVLSYFGQGYQVVIDDATVLTAYGTTGFNPNAGPSGSNPTDNGSTLQTGLAYLAATGMQGVKIDAFAEINVQEISEIKLAIAELGPIDLALSVPQSMEQQFAAGQPITVVEGSPLVGGHCVTGVGYDADYLYIHTWGAEVKVSWDFVAAYFNQAFALLSREWINAKTTLDPEHVNLLSLGAAYAAITGGENPFAVSAVSSGECPVLRFLRGLRKLILG
jgi:hypothetical protein